MRPEELLYTPTHEWAHLAEEGGNRVATIGLSAFALEQLTDLVYIELPQVGRKVTAGEAIGEIESVKAVSDIYSPVSGEIVQVNTELKPEALDILSEDPYGRGWIVKIQISQQSELDQLLDYQAYQRQCAEE